ILFDDGSWFYRPVAGKTPVGVIFCVGRGNEHPNYREFTDKEVMGYAVSITDAGDYIWGPTGIIQVKDPEYPTAVNNELTIYYGELKANQLSVTNYFLGYTVTQNVINDKYYTGEYGTFRISKKPYENQNPDKYAGTMFTGLSDYSARVSVPSGSSGWYIPTMKQFDVINTNLDVVNSSLGKIGDADPIEPFSTSSKTYWSVNASISTPYDKAYYYQIKGNNAIRTSGEKTIERTLRPILTFWKSE
ncbi:MAG: hypothetical protein K2K88_06700, partial [Muribaculaceae bacterium]|nr:hypothetical protein [Muribaculaceae bacterium]